MAVYEYINNLKTNQELCLKFLHDGIGLGNRRSQLIYEFMENNVFNETSVVRGIGPVTMTKINSYNFTQRKVFERISSTEEIILSAFKEHPQLNLQEIYTNVYNEVGGYVNLKTLQKYVYADGRDVDPVTCKKNFEGFIRSFLEEHSSDSRQHFVKNNRIVKNGVAPNLFSNESLRRRNEIIGWKMLYALDPVYRSRLPKTDGIWTLRPSLAKPTEIQFEEIQREIDAKNVLRARTPAYRYKKDRVVITRAYLTVKI